MSIKLTSKYFMLLALTLVGLLVVAACSTGPEAGSAQDDSAVDAEDGGGGDGGGPTVEIPGDWNPTEDSLPEGSGSWADDLPWESMGNVLGSFIVGAIDGTDDPNPWKEDRVYIYNFSGAPMTIAAGSEYCGDGFLSQEFSSSTIGGSGNPLAAKGLYKADSGAGGNTRIQCSLTLSSDILVGWNHDQDGPGGSLVGINKSDDTSARYMDDPQYRVGAQMWSESDCGDEDCNVLVIQIGSMPNCPTDWCGLKLKDVPEKTQITLGGSPITQYPDNFSTDTAWVMLPGCFRDFESAPTVQCSENFEVWSV